MRRILFIRPDRIGDFVIFSGVVQYYQMLFPDYVFHIVCLDIVKDLAKACPYFQAVFSLSPEDLYGDWSWWQRIKLKMKLGLRTYDMVIYPVYSRLSSQERLFSLVRTKQKIVFDGDTSNDSRENLTHNNRAYDRVIVSSKNRINELERNFEMVKKLGYIGPFPKLNSAVWYGKRDVEWVSSYLAESRFELNKYIVIAPGASSKDRIWPHKKWAELVESLMQTWGIPVICVGDGGDTKHYYAIKTFVRKSQRFENGCGLFSLNQTAVMLKHARLVVGAESGPIHLAAAVKTPNVCLIGGGHFGRFYPYGDLNRNTIVTHIKPCFQCNWKCRYKQAYCVTQIPTKLVIQQANSLLKET